MLSAGQQLCLMYILLAQYLDVGVKIRCSSENHSPRTSTSYLPLRGSVSFRKMCCNQENLEYLIVIFWHTWA